MEPNLWAWAILISLGGLVLCLCVVLVLAHQQPSNSSSLNSLTVRSRAGAISVMTPTDLGLQVDAWGALVMDRANLARRLEQMTLALVGARGLANLSVDKRLVALEEMLSEKREHAVFMQRLPRGGQATAVLRVAKRGKNDLEISWRLFEKNPVKELGASTVACSSQGCLTFFGGIFILAGIVTSIFGYGLILICIGVGMFGFGSGWFVKRQVQPPKTSMSTYGQFDSRVLALNVDAALMKALASLGVAAQELRVLRQASTEGIGNLKAVSLIDAIIPPEALEQGLRLKG